MKNTTLWITLSLLVLSAPALGQAPAVEKETLCTDGIDNDGDGLEDCGDADCAADPACAPDGKPENTDKRCSDWIDNDNDGYVDCDDRDCDGPLVTVCKGSWVGSLDGSGLPPAPGVEKEASAPSPFADLNRDMTEVDLIGTQGDVDGERNDFLCSDGVDNDGDGRTDCQDFGCRFDPDVRVCTPAPNFRFSVVAGIATLYDLEEGQPDARFSKLQLRALGAMPGIQDSFFLISMRAEKTPRLTFAMFQVPLSAGHFLNVNSGGGGLSNRNVVGSQKQLLLDPPYALNSAFEQGNGAAVEVSGPIDTNGKLNYRTYFAGGSGVYAGNVGGRYYEFEDQNFTWGGGAQVQWNLIGAASRWDSQYLYVSVPLTTAITVGGKYDERAQERYPAANLQYMLRWKRFTFQTEGYFKHELEFGAQSMSYYAQAGFLIWPKHLMLGADYGQFLPGDAEEKGAGIPYAEMGREMRQQQEATLWRAALHWYFYKNIGVATLLYSDVKLTSRNPDADDPIRKDREARLEIQYRF